MAQTTDSQCSDSPTRVIELAVNLDDTPGELIGHAIGRLLALGALDAWATPITMKKGRPGVTLSVLARESERDALAEALLGLTGSFGVRFRAWDRVVLERAWHDRPTRLGKVKLKAGALAGRTVAVKPEFEDVLRLAGEAGVSAAEAHRAASAAADGLLAELRQGDQASGGGS